MNAEETYKKNKILTFGLINKYKKHWLYRPNMNTHMKQLNLIKTLEHYQEVIENMAQFILKHDIDEEICKKVECSGECLSCVSKYFGMKFEENENETTYNRKRT